MEKNENTKEDVFRETANRVSAVTILGNTVLSVLKFLAGIVAHSNAMISDAVHSASDVFSTVVVIIGIRLSAKESDKEHPYGHERLECVAAIILAMVLFITGLGIGIKAARNILSGDYASLQIPGIPALIAAGRCVAPPFGCLFIHRRVNRNYRGKIRLSDYGFRCQSCHFLIYRKGCPRHF